MKRKTWLVLPLCSLLLWGVGMQTAIGYAAESDSTATEEQTAAEDLRDPEALSELKKATDFLAALPRFQFKAMVFYDVIQEDGRRLQFEKHGTVFLQRPDRLFADISLDDNRHRQIWYDGKALGIAELTKKIHTRLSAPATIDATLDMLENLFKDPMPMADLLYSDLTPLSELAFEADVVGDSLVNGRMCRHLAFRGETVDWQLWVETGEKPFIRKLVVSYREQPGTPQYAALIDDWETPESFGKDLFTFITPEGSEEISILVPMSHRGQKGEQP